MFILYGAGSVVHLVGDTFQFFLQLREAVYHIFIGIAARIFSLRPRMRYDLFRFALCLYRDHIFCHELIRFLTRDLECAIRLFLRLRQDTIPLTE